MAVDALVNVFARSPNAIVIPVAGVFSALALTPSPNFLALVFLVGSIVLHSYNVQQGRATLRHTIVLLLAITLGGTIARLTPATTALHRSMLSVLILFFASMVAAAISMAVSKISSSLQPRITTGWYQLMLFPALWSFTWTFFAFVSPVGRLSVWSPQTGLEAYTWTRSWTGSFGIDFIVGAWAVVIVEFLGRAAPVTEPMLVDLGPYDVESTPDLDIPIVQAKHKPVGVLVLLLSALAVPSFISCRVPLAPSGSTTSITVGCALPDPQLSGDPLDWYIRETKQFSAADIFLWPEGAIRFMTEEAKNAGIAKIQAAMANNRRVVGVSFLSPATGDIGVLENTLLLLERDQVLDVYHKRNVVPIAESFHQVGSRNRSPLVEVKLPLPRRKNGFRLTLNVTLGICLDLAKPLSELASRPALILAPASTWQQDVGFAMWNHAKSRAEELGTNVLWCDGGREGYSGITGVNGDQVIQVGSGSWIKKIEIPSPFSQTRTAFGLYNEAAGIVIVSALCILPGLILYRTQEEQVALTVQVLNLFAPLMRSGTRARVVMGLVQARLLDWWQRPREASTIPQSDRMPLLIDAD